MYTGHMQTKEPAGEVSSASQTETVVSAAEKPKRHVKVVRFRILKPVGEMTWEELGKVIRDARYRVFRLANLAVSEAYLQFHVSRTKQDEVKTEKLGALSRRLREMLRAEKTSDADLDRYSKTGALPAYVTDALAKNKIGAITTPNKWKQVLRGQSALPTFRLEMAIPIRCDKPGMKRLARDEKEVVVDLMLCVKPYPRVILQTGSMSDGERAIMEQLLDNPTQSLDGYRQRCFEVKEDTTTRKWWLYVTYDFPAKPSPARSKDIIVGVDLGWSCPLYAAINNGHARLGRKQFQALGARIRSLQRQVMARRRDVQRGGRIATSAETGRSGHGRKRKLRPIRILEGRIDRAYKTLNHQLSATVVDFAVNHGAGVIQIENLAGLREHLTGTFIGANWRYHQLQEFLRYKADEAGIELLKVNPMYTSRRCHKCGHIHQEFSAEYRQKNRVNGYACRFKCPCPECELEEDADYNAARNLATVDIEGVIERQCKAQGIILSALSQDEV